MVKQVDDILDDLDNTFEYTEQEENIDLDLKYDQKNKAVNINRNPKKSVLALQLYKNIRNNISSKATE